MKKTIAILLLIIFPATVFGAIATGWTATSTAVGYIAPTAINSNVPYIQVPYLVTTTTNATSTFAQPISFTLASTTGTATSTLSGINLPYGGCYAVNGTCVGGSSFVNTLANGGTATTTFYANGLVYSDGTKLTQPASSSSLYFNPTNSGLGLGTSTPKETLQVNGNVRIGKSKNGAYPYLPTTTANPLSSGATTIPVTDTSSFPLVGTIRIDNEYMEYTGLTSTSFTGVTRGVLKSSASSHVLGSTIIPEILTIQVDDQNPIVYVNSGSSLGVGGDIDGRIGINRSPQAIFDIYSTTGVVQGTPLFVVGDSNQSNQFVIADRTSTNFQYGLITGNLVVGDINNVHSIYDQQLVGNKITIWDASLNGTWNAGGSINLQTNGNKVGIGTTTPWGQLSVNPNALGSGVPEFVIGSTTKTHFVVNGAGNVGIGTTTPFAPLSVTGNVNNTGTNTSGLLLGAGIPTIATSTGSGTTGSATISGSNSFGKVSVTTSLGTVASAIVTVTSPSLSAPTSLVCTITPGNANAAALGTTANVYVTSDASTWTINAGTVALSISTTYTWNYVCGGY